MPGTGDLCQQACTIRHGTSGDCRRPGKPRPFRHSSGDDALHACSVLQLSALRYQSSVPPHCLMVQYGVWQGFVAAHQCKCARNRLLMLPNAAQPLLHFIMVHMCDAIAGGSRSHQASWWVTAPWPPYTTTAALEIMRQSGYDILSSALTRRSPRADQRMHACSAICGGRCGYQAFWWGTALWGAYPPPLLRSTACASAAMTSRH